MKMTFKEACSAVATMYEVAPETYCTAAYWRADKGFMRIQSQTKDICSWCAVGGVSLAIGSDVYLVTKALNRFCERTEDAHIVSDRGIEHAIRLLRLAAGEVE